MGRAPRADEAGNVYHMLNRSNRRAQIFHKDADYEAFERIIAEALDKFKLQLFSYCVMPNHWHLVVMPQIDGEMSRFAQWIGLTHTQRHHAHYKTVGDGHLYQGRYKSFPVQCDDHYLTVCRYVERNAYTAGLCDAPDSWRFCSLWRWRHGTPQDKTILSAWPIPRRRGWLDWVSQELSSKERQRLSWSIKRGAPFGDETWVESVARRFDLESTMRPQGRPRKFRAAQ